MKQVLNFESIENELKSDVRLSTKQVLSLVDLTLLDPNASQTQIKSLCSKAQEHKVAAVCIFNDQIPWSLGYHANKATVLNFPSGKENHRHVIHTLENILNNPAIDEIDYVFNYQAYYQNNRQLALDQYQDVAQLVNKSCKTLKVILESGFQSNQQALYGLSLAILDISTPCNFLKTSTGKISNGATPQALYTMLQAIKDTSALCGVKVSGGVQTYEQAKLYIQLAQYVLQKPVSSDWFRIGASSLVDNLLQETNASAATY
jgi:deoxyribose-phosphate aldolase